MGEGLSAGKKTVADATQFRDDFQEGAKATVKKNKRAAKKSAVNRTLEAEVPKVTSAVNDTTKGLKANAKKVGKLGLKTAAPLAVMDAVNTGGRELVRNGPQGLFNKVKDFVTQPVTPELLLKGLGGLVGTAQNPMDTIKGMADTAMSIPTELGKFAAERMASDETRRNLAGGIGTQPFGSDPSTSVLNAIEDESLLDENFDQPQELSQAAPPPVQDSNALPVGDGAAAGTTAVDGSVAPAENNQPLSLRDALNGFKRTGNVIGDGLALQSRLGISSSINRTQEKRLKFQEEQRNNDFDHAVGLAELEIEGMKAQGLTTRNDIKKQQLANQSWQDAVGAIDGRNDLSDADKDTQVKSVSFQAAETSGFNPGSPPTLELYAGISDAIEASRDEGLARLQHGFGAFGDKDAPLFDAGTVQDFTVSDGVVYFDGDPVSDLDEIGDKQDQQYIMAVLNHHDNVGKKRSRAR